MITLSAHKHTFYHILANTVIANIINMTVWFAISFYAYLETKNVVATAVLSGIYTLTVALTGIWFGSLVDHYKKRTMLLISSAISLLFYIICLSIYVMTSRDTFSSIENPVFWLFTTLLLFGVIAGNIRTITLTTLVQLLVPEGERDKANGLVGTTTGIAFLTVSVLSGILVGFAGMYLVLILAIIFTFAAIIHMYQQRIPEKKVQHLTDELKPKHIDLKGTLLAIRAVPGLLGLIFFSAYNNFLGGVFMSLMDAYGLSLVSVQVWGILWGVISTGFIVGGIIIAKYGVGKNPVRSLFVANLFIWSVCCFFTLNQSIIPLLIGNYLYIIVVPLIESAEQTIFQKVVPYERLGRVVGFSQSVEQMAAPVTAFLIGPMTQYIMIPYMTTGSGVTLIGDWFGTGSARGIALVFTLTGILGLCMTLIAMRSRQYKLLSKAYAG